MGGGTTTLKPGMDAVGEVPGVACGPTWAPFPHIAPPAITSWGYPTVPGGLVKKAPECAALCAQPPFLNLAGTELEQLEGRY